MIRKVRKLATDHRALVLESVATHPTRPTKQEVVADCVGPDFPKKNVDSMIWWLVREGLIGQYEDGYFITRTGFDWLVNGNFDRALPAPHTRPGARKPRQS